MSKPNFNFSRLASKFTGRQLLLMSKFLPQSKIEFQPITPDYEYSNEMLVIYFSNLDVKFYLPMINSDNCKWTTLVTAISPYIGMGFKLRSDKGRNYRL